MGSVAVQAIAPVATTLWLGERLMKTIAEFPDVAAEPVAAEPQSAMRSAEPAIESPALPTPLAENADPPPRSTPTQALQARRRQQPRRRRTAGGCRTVSPLPAVTTALRSQGGSVAVLAVVAAAVWTVVLMVERQPLPGMPGMAEPVAGVRVAADLVAHDGSEETRRQ